MNGESFHFGGIMKVITIITWSDDFVKGRPFWISDDHDFHVGSTCRGGIHCNSEHPVSIDPADLKE